MQSMRRIVTNCRRRATNCAILHRIPDARLFELSSKPYRSVSQELEEHTLKKHKLALKDQIEQVMRGLEHQS